MHKNWVRTSRQSSNFEKQTIGLRTKNKQNFFKPNFPSISSTRIVSGTKRHLWKIKWKSFRAVTESQKKTTFQFKLEEKTKKKSASRCVTFQNCLIYGTFFERWNFSYIRRKDNELFFSYLSAASLPPPSHQKPSIPKSPLLFQLLLKHGFAKLRDSFRCLFILSSLSPLPRPLP